MKSKIEEFVQMAAAANSKAGFLVVKQPIGPIARQSDSSVSLVFPGAFNPIHKGHIRMAEIAVEKTGQPCHFEICIDNADKGRVDTDQLVGRCSQNFGSHGLLISPATRFVDKAELFPGATFIVGADTLTRLANVKYYAGEPAQMIAAFETIANAGCQFLVFARRIMSQDSSFTDDDLPDELKQLCRFVPREEFEMDISSTELRESK